MRTVVFLDLDGTCADHTKRALNAGPCPPREELDQYKHWVKTINTGMNEDSEVPGMRDLANSLYRNCALFYLTNRGDQHRTETTAWLNDKGFPPAPLIMRDPHSWNLGDGEYKALEIKKLLHSNPYYSVIMVDDDPRGEIQRMCDDNGWTFLKAIYHAK